MEKNNPDNSYNEEESQADEIDKIQESIYASLDNVKKHIDNNKDILSSLLYINSIREIYDTQAIPFLKKSYSENPSEKELYSARADKAYEMFNGVYQHALKKLESFGINPSILPELKLPKSLEKITFPANN